jgi:hypothetical protein
MKLSKIRKHIRNSRRVFAPVIVGEETHFVPVQKSAFLETLKDLDKGTEFPATVKFDGEDFTLTFGVETS